MKTRILLMSALICGLGIITINAQDKQSELKEQKEEMALQEIEMKEQLKSVQETQERFRDVARSYATSYSTGDGLFSYFGSGGSTSQLSLSKYYEAETKKNSGTFNVDESVRQINLNLSGNVRSGKIKIKIQLENEDIVKELTFDESADVTFTQTIRISEEEKKYYGDWKYIVDAQNATGKYRLSIHTH